MGRFNNFDQFLELFPPEPRKRIKDGYNVICPSHNDKDPSLSVTCNDSKILINCKARCTKEAVLDKLDLSMADLFLNSGIPKKIVQVYPYHDEKGEILFEVVRLEPKDFRMRRPDGIGGFHWNLDGTRRVLYHLPLILKAQAQGESIWIAEGEKDVDRLWGLKLAATCNPCGAGKWLPEYSEPLKGTKEIIILQDNDSPGKNHALTIAKSLVNKGIFVKLIPPFPDAKDVSEWLDKKHTRKELLALAESTPYYEPTQDIPVSPESKTGIGEPKITPVGQGYEFLYTTELGKSVTVHVRRIHKSKSDDLIAEIDISGNHQEDMPKPILGLKLNLSSFTARKRLAKDIGEGKSIPFPEIIDDITRKLIELYREGDSIQESCPSENVQPVKYLIEPLIHEDNPTIVFGEKGVAKSYLAALVTVIARLPWYNNPLGLTVSAEKPIPVLYIDWERSKDVLDWRLSQITKGHNLDFVSVDYLRCYQPLADMVEKIEKAKNERGYRLLIIDSLALAAGGNVNEAETAIKFHVALRRLNLSSLILAQTSKDFLTRKHSVFGSVHFEYYASSIWEAKKTQEEDSPEMVMSLTHTRYNLSSRHNPIGLKFTFTKESDEIEPKKLKVFRTDLAKTELSNELPAKDRMYSLLSREGLMREEEIAENIGESVQTTRRKLYQYKDKMFVKVGKQWGAIAKVPLANGVSQNGEKL